MFDSQETLLPNQVIVVSSEEQVYQKRAKEQYGDWTARYEFSVLEARKTTPRYSYGHDTFTLGFDVNPGDVLFALYMTYSEGDSFGRAYGKGEVLWVFKDAQLGYKAIERVLRNEKEYRFKFEVEDGSDVEVGNPANGYFESLENVELKSLLVNP